MNTALLQQQAAQVQGEEHSVTVEEQQQAKKIVKEEPHTQTSRLDHQNTPQHFTSGETIASCQVA